MSRRPEISFNDGVLQIVDKKKVWNVKVTDVRASTDPAQPLMTVMK
jgi:hypothetical protein